MDPTTRELWDSQDRHEGDRGRLFAAVAEVVGTATVLYPGCFVDIAPSFVFAHVTYVDVDRRARRFFADGDGVDEIITRRPGAPRRPRLRFISGDYTEPLDLAEESFDLLVSLYAGFVSEHCTRYLRVGGVLLVNPSHGDAALASIDPRFRLAGVVDARSGTYRVRPDDLDGYLVPDKPVTITADLLHDRGRGIAYTRSPFAYVFERIR